MKSRLVLIGCLWWLFLSLLAFAGEQEPDSYPLCRELELAGLKILSSGTAFGVPYAEIQIPTGASITSICRQVDSLNKDFSRCREKIAFFNALHPSYIKTLEPQPFSLESDTIKIPLNLELVPKIFPSRDESLKAHDKFILVDIGKGFLALYSRGELHRVFPVSAGLPGQETPLISFVVRDKRENHWSTIYDTWMPWALLIRAPYYIHGGVLPGKRDSAGCIRLLLRDAEELYHLVEVGTPGRIIYTPETEKTWSAPVCR